MNFVKCSCFDARASRAQIFSSLLLALLLSIYLVGCSDQVRLPLAWQLAEFENVRPLHPAVDMDRLVKARTSGGPYRVGPGDVLELTMPAILQVVTAEESVPLETSEPYICRINENGYITLPVVGGITVAGKSSAQIESAIVAAYYPEYAVTLPSVFAKVLEYEMARVSISGAVKEPGVYSLRTDQMSLVALLMAAGGIIDEGAVRIQIIHSDNEETVTGALEESLQVPNKAAERVKGVIHDTTEERGKQSRKHAVEQLPKQIDAELAEPAIRRPGSSEIEVKLSFRPTAVSSTIGGLTVKDGEQVLLTEQLDVTSEIERFVLLGQLAQREPRVSTVKVNQKLCALAELLKPGSDSHKSRNMIVNENISSIAKGGSSKIQRGYLFGRITDQKSNVSTTDAEQGLWAPAKLLGSDYRRYDSQNISTNSIFTNAEHNIDYSRQSPTIDNAPDEDSESLVLPVKGFNIPFADIVLQDGDSVIVQRLEQPLFSVMGLVYKPGNFPYPPGVEYNLMQALGFAGGLDQAADPRYATIYRLKPDGTIVSAIFEVAKKVANEANGSQFADALNTHIRPGDIVVVEHTPRTRAKVFLDRIIRLNIGTYLRLDDAWE